MTLQNHIDHDDPTYHLSGGWLALKVLPTDGGAVVSLTGGVGAGQDYDAYHGRAVTFALPTTVIPASLRAWVDDHADAIETLADCYEGAEWNGQNHVGSWDDEDGETRTWFGELLARALDGTIHQRWSAVDYLQDGLDVDEIVEASALYLWVQAEVQHALESGQVVEADDLRACAVDALEDKAEDLRQALQEMGPEETDEEDDADDRRELADELAAIERVLKGLLRTSRAIGFSDEELARLDALLKEVPRKSGNGTKTQSRTDLILDLVEREERRRSADGSR